MKLYVINPANQKIYLNLTAPTRDALRTLIGGDRFSLGSDTFNIREVFADVDRSSAAAGAVVGGAVGTLAGPIGILIGGFVGGLIGSGSYQEELSTAERFNRS